MTAPELDRWRLDLESHVLFAPDAADGLEDGRHFWSTSYQHETAHWVRWQTCSIGLLVTLLRRARTVTAWRFLNQLGSREARLVAEIAARRPLWSFETGYEPTLVDADFALAGQFYLDLRAFESLLLDSSVRGGDDWPAAEAVGPALSDAWRAAEGFQGARPHPGNAEADHLFWETPGQSGVPKLDPRLTTRGIWETACTLDELSAVPRDQPGLDVADHRRMVQAKLESDHYGFAARVAIDLAGPLSPRTFGLIAWLATDPPLPFFEDDVSALRWSTFTPPHRFVRLYEAAGSRPSLRRFPHEDDLYDFADDLLRVAKMRRAAWPLGQPTEPRLETPEGTKVVPVHGWSLDLRPHPSVTQKFVGSLNALIKTSRACRMALSQAPSKFVYPNYEDIYFGAASGSISESTLQAQSLRTLLVPLAMDFADGLYQGGLDPGTLKPIVAKQDMAEIIASIFLRASLDSFLTNTPARASTLPRAFRPMISDRGSIIAKWLTEGTRATVDW